MPRIDLSSREWHELIRPVLPHALNDAEFPQLAVVRIEAAEHAVYAVATDRYTLGAERHPLTAGYRLWDIPQPAHVRLAEAATSLKLFPYSKDYDPPLRLTIAKMPVPIAVAGRQTTIDHLAVTIEADDGTRLVMHDKRDPSNDPLASWRKHLATAVTRALPAAAPSLMLNATQLGRWGAAVRKGERLAVFTGAKGDEMLLVLVESHFCGVWQPVSYLDGPEKMLAESAWRDELAEVPWLGSASGLETGDGPEVVHDEKDEPGDD